MLVVSLASMLVLAGPPEQSLATRVDAILAAAYAPNEPGAVIIVLKDGKVILRRAYGLANLEAHAPLHPETRFPIGSITKQLTAALILRLVDDGVLRLEDDIGRWFPEYRERLQGVTIEHLLTHTSGVPAYTDLREWVELAMQGRAMERPAIVTLVLKQPPKFRAGEAEEYSNSNYLLLASILESVSGRPYRHLIRDRLLKPLGMLQTDCGGSDAVRPLVGYNPDGQSPASRIGDDAPVGGCHGDGGLVTTVDDLARWNAAITDGKAFSSSSAARMFTPFLMNGRTPTSAAYGWEPWNYEGHALFVHSGYVFGFVSYVVRAPQERLYVALLSNNPRSEPSGPYLAKRIATIALGKPYEPATVALPNQALGKHVGVYEKSDKSQRRVILDGQQLYTERVGGRRYALLPESATSFAFRNSFSRMQFETDAGGQTIRARIFGEGPEEAWTRTGDIKERKAIRVHPTVLEGYVGRYELFAGHLLTITREGENLFAQPAGGAKEELFAESETDFFLKSSDVEFRFARDAAGTVTHVSVIQGGGTLEAKRLP